ncbi:MAG: transposase [Actinoplanes sp.]|nr:transposase [Actinoplanes sp.]
MTGSHVGSAAVTSRANDEVVLGVDTHKDAHVAVVLSGTGVLLETCSFPTTAASYQQMIAWARSFATLKVAGVEGTGSYGAGLSRALRAAGVHVIEVNRPDRAARRRRGKTDAVDAESAARAVLSGEAAALAKTGDGPVEDIRVLKVAKDSAVKARVQAINQLKAILVSSDPALREQLSTLNTRQLVQRCAGLEDGVGSATVVYVLQLLARRIQSLAGEITALQQRITTVVTATAPQLMEVTGIGPDAAATLLVTAGDNPHRLTTEAAFAALCGVSPVEASSGKTHRLRLNRGGDRQANAALFRAVLIRLRWHPPTREYLQRRTVEGRTKREVIRCLKRYLARTIYKIIVASQRPSPS